MGDKNEQTKIDSKYLPPQFALVARICVGGYLLYTAFSLFDSVVNGEGTSRYWMGIAMVVFTIVGILLVFFSGRDMLRGKYVGGAMDAGTEEEEEEAENILKAEEPERRLEAEEPENDVERAEAAGETAFMEENADQPEAEKMEAEK